MLFRAAHVNRVISAYFGLFWVILGYFGLFWVILSYFDDFSRRSVYGLFWYFRVILVNRVISAYSYKSCYFNVFGSFWAIFGHISGYFGSFRESIGGFVKRVISSYFVSSSKKLIKRVTSGYSRESCYLGQFRLFLVIFGHFWSF